jgi:Tol biopolymer transport system component
VNRVGPVLLGLVGVALLAAALRPAAAPPVRPHPTFAQRTFDPDVEQHPSFAPSGQELVYARDEALVVQRLGDPRPTPLDVGVTGTLEGPAWSPDGARIAFESANGLWVASASGEGARRITDFGGGAAWTPDGRALVFHGLSGFAPFGVPFVPGLWTVPVDGGDPASLGGLVGLEPNPSPDGAWLAFWSPDTGLSIARADGSEPIVVVPGWRCWSPRWTADSGAVLFLSNHSGTHDLWRIAVREGHAAGDPEPLVVGDVDPLESFALSPDGRRAIVVDVDSTGQIFRVDPASGQVTRLTRGKRWITMVTSSPDGTRMAYTTAGGEERLFLANADGTAPVLLFRDDAVRDPQWSPDGATIAAETRTGTAFSITRIPVDGSAPSRTPDPDVTGVAWSPDGVLLAIHSLEHGADILSTGPGESRVVAHYDEAIRDRIASPGGAWTAVAGVARTFVVDAAGREVWSDADGHAVAWLGPDRLMVARRRDVVVVDLPTAAATVIDLSAHGTDVGPRISAIDGAGLVVMNQWTTDLWEVDLDDQGPPPSTSHAP